MNIGQHILNSYDTNISNRNVPMEHSKGTTQVTMSGANPDISGLREGTVFKGEILDIVGNKVIINLENQKELQARLQGSVELGIGDILLFSVKENTSSQIMIKPLFDSLYSAQAQALEKVLDAAGLSPTEKNFSVAKELMEAGMPVDKNSLVKILAQSMKFEGASMQTLIALNKMNIPVTEANIVQYERYRNQNHQLLDNIGQTAEKMISFIEAFPEDTSGTTLLSVADRIINLFLSEEERSENQTVRNIFVNNENTKSIEATQTDKLFFAESENAAKVIGSGEDISLLKHSEGMQKEVVPGEYDVYEQITEKTGLTKETILNLEYMLRKAGVSNKQITWLFWKTDSIDDLLKNITQSLNKSGGSDVIIREILDSEEYKKILGNMIKNHWAINPAQMKEPKEIDELYNKILQQGKAFEQIITSNGGSAREFNQGFQNMRQNMQFMEQLNQQMIYAQMPLKLSNQSANSELYVYADKRKLTEKKDGISVMLHLEMDYLGMTDVKVTLTGTNVNARFYLNDQESVDIVADNIGQLEKQLAKRGFSLTQEVIKREQQESLNLVVDEIIDENAERSIKRYTFDAKT